MGSGASRNHAAATRVMSATTASPEAAESSSRHNSNRSNQSPHPLRLRSRSNSRRSHIDSPDESQTSTPTAEEVNLRSNFALSAMSLGMDNEDLIFNLLYFGGNAGSANFHSMFNTAMEETVAAHSANNTPYKLQPATDDVLSALRVSIVSSSDTVVDSECTICQDMIEAKHEIVSLTACDHHFHKECLLRWLRLQNWCPVCRHIITADDTPNPVMKLSFEEANVNDIPPEAQEHSVAVSTVDGIMRRVLSFSRDESS